MQVDTVDTEEVSGEIADPAAKERGKRSPTRSVMPSPCLIAALGCSSRYLRQRLEAWPSSAKSTGGRSESSTRTRPHASASDSDSFTTRVGSNQIALSPVQRNLR
jgi:hypothetical protein